MTLTDTKMKRKSTTLSSLVLKTVASVTGSMIVVIAYINIWTQIHIHTHTDAHARILILIYTFIEIPTHIKCQSQLSQHFTDY